MVIEPSKELAFAKTLSNFMGPIKVAGNEVLNAMNHFQDPDMAEKMLVRAQQNLHDSGLMLAEAVKYLR